MIGEQHHKDDDDEFVIFLLVLLRCVFAASVLVPRTLILWEFRKRKQEEREKARLDVARVEEERSNTTPVKWSKENNTPFR